MGYYKVSYGGHDMKIIAARNKFEAVGYYLLKVQNGTGFVDDVEVEEVSPMLKIEVECIGFPKYKTVEELFKEKKGFDPCIVIGIVE